MDWYPWIVFLHVVGAFGFVFGHGASAIVSMAIRRQTDAQRISAMLRISQLSLTVMYPSLLLLLAAGVAAGFIGELWGALWLWLAIGLLVVELAAMYALAAPYYMNLRRALTDPTVPDDEVVASMSSSRPIVLAWVGIVGLLLIVWLMVVKPF
ncbi:MAG TPA: DUF2269 family protein [Candidatus Limnocylindria bacterium]|nr:DUF2269 family protein [Candidatus Limnocylindria bacterium]